MSYVLGIDGGGSKTVCILMDETDKVLGCGQSKVIFPRHEPAYGAALLALQRVAGEGEF